MSPTNIKSDRCNYAYIAGVFGEGILRLFLKICVGVAISAITLLTVFQILHKRQYFLESESPEKRWVASVFSVNIGIFSEQVKYIAIRKKILGVAMPIFDSDIVACGNAWVEGMKIKWLDENTVQIVWPKSAIWNMKFRNEHRNIKVVWEQPKFKESLINGFWVNKHEHKTMRIEPYNFYNNEMVVTKNGKSRKTWWNADSEKMVIGSTPYWYQLSKESLVLIRKLDGYKEVYKRRLD